MLNIYSNLVEGQYHQAEIFYDPYDMHSVENSNFTQLRFIVINFLVTIKTKKPWWSPIQIF